MMQKLKSMGVLNHLNLDQLDIPEKVVKKVVVGGSSTKDSCYASIHNTETIPPQLDNSQRLSSMIDEILEVCMFKLKHEPTQEYMFHGSFVVEFFKGDDWLDIPVI